MFDLTDFEEIKKPKQKIIKPVEDNGDLRQQVRHFLLEADEGDGVPFLTIQQQFNLSKKQLTDVLFDAMLEGEVYEPVIDRYRALD
jgi:AraC-like DNA-binding protein